MANLAIVGSHSTNGVAAIHSRLLRTTTVKDLAEIFPERFNNKTNGVTPRRWLHLANPALAARSRQPSATVGSAICRSSAGSSPWPTMAAFAGNSWKRSGRPRCRSRTGSRRRGQSVDPDTIFDCQVKRIHEYKRQLLNALRIVVLYNRLRENPNLEVVPRTFFFAGKAAPAYHLAKRIIKFINNLAGTIDGDPAVRGRLKVVFLPDYSVTMAERLIPAADVSNQISTAGYEASGTSNMKFMMNGALDDRHPRRGDDRNGRGGGRGQFFSVRADRRAGGRRAAPGTIRTGIMNNEPETRAALDLIFSDHFSRNEPGGFALFRDVLLGGDYYMHLADLKSYLEADGRLVASIQSAKRLGAKGDSQRRGVGKVFERLHDRGIRRRHLERGALPRGVKGIDSAPLSDRATFPWPLPV